MTQDVKMQFTWAMAKDGASVMVEIQNSRSGASADIIMDAHDLDNVINNLAQARANMKPAHPRNLDPQPVFRNVVKGASFHISATRVLPESGAKVCLAALHPGMGWIAFSLAPKEAMELAAHLATKANEVGHMVKLVGLDGKPLA